MSENEREEDVRRWVDDLDPKTRAFLSRLRPDDIPLIEEGIAMTRSILTVGRMVRWFIICIMGIWLAGEFVYEKAGSILAWVRAR